MHHKLSIFHRNDRSHHRIRLTRRLRVCRSTFLTGTVRKFSRLVFRSRRCLRSCRSLNGCCFCLLLCLSIRLAASGDPHRCNHHGRTGKCCHSFHIFRHNKIPPVLLYRSLPDCIVLQRSPSNTDSRPSWFSKVTVHSNCSGSSAVFCFCTVILTYKSWDYTMISITNPLRIFVVRA